ncbi:MAG: hypothetical protein NTX31_01625 [Burkholderiales bacterium]|nr:hypothetical protein [Burkholderiales bacterium]
MRFILRVVLLVASLLVAALVLLALWLLRSLWARLNGRPVTPWTFKVDRQALWDRFYRTPGQVPKSQRDDSDVIDVEAKEKPP